MLSRKAGKRIEPNWAPTATTFGRSGNTFCPIVATGATTPSSQARTDKASSNPSETPIGTDKKQMDGELMLPLDFVPSEAVLIP